MKNIKRIQRDRYEIYFSYQHKLTGDRRYVRRRVEGSLQDAIAERDRLKVAARNGELDRPTEGRSRPLKDWLDDYMYHREHRDRLAVSTLETERYYLEGGVLPDTGNWLPEEIEIHHIDELVDRWMHERKDGGGVYSPATIQNRLRYLKQFLRWVLKRCRRNPAFLRDVDGIKREKGSRRRGRALTPDLARAFLGEMKEAYPQHYALVFVLLLTGQRFGSVTALRWSDIGDDWITFARSQYRGALKAGGKSGKVVRLPLTDEVRDVLDWHRQEMIVGQHPGLSTGLVFPTMKSPEASATNGFRCAGDLRHPFSRVCETVGIDHLTPHDLRRTFNSWAAERVPGTVLRSITGHSSSEMTDHYYYGSKEAKAAVLHEVVSLVT